MWISLIRTQHRRSCLWAGPREGCYVGLMTLRWILTLLHRQSGYAATFPGRSSGVSSAAFSRFGTAGGSQAVNSPDRWVPPLSFGWIFIKERKEFLGVVQQSLAPAVDVSKVSWWCPGVPGPLWGGCWPPPTDSTRRVWPQSERGGGWTERRGCTGSNERRGTASSVSSFFP